MKKRYLILILILSLTLWSCDANENTVNNNNVEVNNMVENNDVTDAPGDEKITFDTIQHSYIEGDEASNILAAEDDYTIKLSRFDYASKYKSNVVLDVEGRKSAVKKNVLNWSDSQKKTIDEAMENIGPKIEALGVEMPEIEFILTNQNDEGGAAYTRENAIILKPYHIGPQTSEGLERLIVHEMFHIFSRANKELRPEMYGVINYLECEELNVPPELFELTIANPDAPDNNYYITGEYKGESYAFIPLIYSTEAYDIEAGESFFRTLKDDMLAVEVVDNVPNPIYIDGELLIVTKAQVDGYFDKIGENTDYTYHPEETIADNFVALVFEDDVPSPWVIEGLKIALKK